MSEFVIKQNGVAKCGGPYPECFPNEAKLKSMRAGGCKIYVDGKLFTGKAPEVKSCGKK